jgi:hypothetical protein
MSAVFVQPKKFTVSSASVTATGPAENMNQDSPGLVWRSNGLSGVYATVQLDGSAWDAVALVKSNLRASDTIQIRAGASAAAVAGTSGLTLNQTISAYSGTDPADGGAITICQLASPVTSAFVRIDVTSTGNPAGYVQAQRLVIGLRVLADGLDLGAEWTPEDGSEVSNDRGFTSINPFGVRTILKLSLTALKESDYWAKWWPFLKSVGKQKAFLCIPDTDPTYLQNQSVFGFMSSSAKGTSISSDLMTVEITMLSTS